MKNKRKKQAKKQAKRKPGRPLGSKDSYRRTRNSGRLSPSAYRASVINGMSGGYNGIGISLLYPPEEMFALSDYYAARRLKR
jgi:hypothetical protein